MAYNQSPQYEAYDPPNNDHRTAYQSTSPVRPKARQRKSMMDELIPLPTSSAPQNKSAPLIPLSVLRRTASVGIISIFLLSIIFLASTEPVQKRTGLRTVFGVGSDVGIEGAGWVAQDLDEMLNGDEMVDGDAEAEGSRHIDFDKYLKMRTIAAEEADLSDGKRLIFIGDIHGSFDPLQRLLQTVNYNMDKDKIIHVGDLIAKGDKNIEVLEWMNVFNIQGVRGNHDQPVVKWRAWMEWAGGKDWERYVDNLDSGGEAGLAKALRSSGKSYPKDWKWKGEHWKIAREMKPRHYKYLLNLPLALHFPSLHTFVVHAGLLPFDPSKSLTDASQPLNLADSSPNPDADASRLSEELSILLDVKPNKDPYTLIEMRSVYTHGKKKGKVTKNSKKGTAWSKVWNKQMKRCTRAAAEEQEDNEDYEDDGGEGEEVEVDSDLKCSPVNVIYGHAAGRGLDIKKYSKGIDTGCVYGRQLTALILGDETRVAGSTVHVGGHKGKLVSIDCGSGGT